jgi:hypothetical protein
MKDGDRNTTKDGPAELLDVVTRIHPDGTSELVTVSLPWPRAKGPPKKYDEDSWDEARCIVEFATNIRGSDSDANQATISAMDRLGCWHKCIDQLCHWPRSAELGTALLWYWMGYGYWRIPRGLKDDIAVFADALRRHRPPYDGPSIRLYRGELEARHLTGTYGIAWTTHIEVAESYARARWDEGDNVVLRIDAPREIIVATPTKHSSETIYEYEYIIDPREIKPTVIKKVPGKDGVP